MSALGELGTLGREKPPGQKPGRGGKVKKRDNLAAYLFLSP